MTRIALQDEIRAFIADLSQGEDQCISPDRFAQRLGMDASHLAELAHVHPSTLEHAPNSAVLQSYLRNAIRVLEAATELNGSVSQSVYWFRNQPLQPLDCKTPEKLVSDGQMEKVLKYIVMLDAGPTG